MFGLFRKRRVRSLDKLPRSQSDQPLIIVLSGDTMGTTYQVRIATTLHLDEARLATRIHSAVDRVDQQMSTWKSDSDLSRFNVAETDVWVPVPDELVVVVKAGLGISQATDGAFDLTIGAAVNAWGFGPKGPVEALPGPQTGGAWRQLEVRDAPPALRKRVPMYVDLSGIAKGYGVDQICAVLHELDLNNYLVSIDGETRVSGRKRGLGGSWRVAVDSPIEGEAHVWDVLEPKNCALATSGDYRRFFDHEGQRFAHTIDPSSGKPLQDAAASVTVMMSSCMLADAWATALLVMSSQKGVAIAQARNMRVLFLFRDGAGFREVATGNILD